jgi:hypothetical protein
MEKSKETVTKSDGNGNIFEVPNPELYNEFGQKIKRRFRPTNFTPKRKKRK